MLKVSDACMIPKLTNAAAIQMGEYKYTCLAKRTICTMDKPTFADRLPYAVVCLLLAIQVLPRNDLACGQLHQVKLAINSEASGLEEQILLQDVADNW